MKEKARQVVEPDGRGSVGTIEEVIHLQDSGRMEILSRRAR